MQHDFTRRLIALRRAHPVFRRESFLEGTIGDGEELPDAWWFRPDGRKMTRHDWDSGPPSLGLFLNGDAIPNPGPHGERVTDDSFLLLFNAGGEEREFTLPRISMGRDWEVAIATADPAAGEPESEPEHHDAHTTLVLPSHSLVVLRRVGRRYGRQGAE